MIDFRCKKFKDLAPAELYEILHLRNEVFVVEQQCVFQDADHRDQQAWHLMGWVDGNLACYTRLLPPGTAYTQMSIGRVVTSPRYRGTGAGRQLMKESIDRCRELFGPGPVKIGAQQYLKQFYESFGFCQSGEGYMEDGIPHIYMIKED